MDQISPHALDRLLPPPSAEVCRRVSRCRACLIRPRALFGPLSLPELDDVAPQVPDVTAPPGTVLYTAGERPEAVFILRHGLVKLEQYLPNGTCRIVRLMRPGAVLALETLVSGECDHTAVVVNRADVCRVPLPVVRTVMEKQPSLFPEMLRHWHQLVRQADDWLTHFSLGGVRQRVARFLLSMGGDEIGQTDASVVELPSRDDLGAILGTTKETVSRMVADFRRDGLLVNLDPHRVRVDRARLEAIAYADSDGG